MKSDKIIRFPKNGFKKTAPYAIMVKNFTGGVSHETH